MARFRLLGVLLPGAGLLLLAYVALVLLAYWQQRSMIYFPQATRLDAAHTDFSLDRGDATLRGWVLQPGQARALLYFGGNAEAVQASADALAEILPGHTLYLPAYRGYGASDGHPTEALLFEDAVALYDEVRRRHPRVPIDVIGRSLGSGVASHLASRRDVDRLVLVTPFDSMAGVARAHYPWLPVDLLMRERYESWRTLPRHQGSLLVVRAGADAVVPAAATDRLLAVLPRAPQVLVLGQAGHDTVSADPRYGAAIGGFLGADSGPSAP